MLSHLLAGALLAAAQSPAPVSVAAPAASEAPIVIGTTHRLSSHVLGDTREINVWLPPGYEKGSERYNVVYLLDGALDQDFHHITGLAQLGALGWTLEPLIVVGIQTRQRRAELTSPAHDPRYLSAYPEGGGAERFRQFLAEEVFPLVEGRYRTGARKAIIGESLAGYFVVDTFLKTPNLFDDYIAVSPSVWWDDRAEVRQAARYLAAHGPSDRRLYLAVGNEGGTMQDGVDRLTAALKTRPPAGLKWRYVDKSASESHSTIYHGAAAEALSWLYARPPFDYGPTPWFMIEGASPPKDKPAG